MTTCPNGVQYVGVSTTVSPVTQTALVAVKSASMKFAPPGPTFAMGSISRIVPTATAIANPDTTAWAGWSRKRRRARTADARSECTRLLTPEL